MKKNFLAVTLLLALTPGCWRSSKKGPQVETTTTETQAAETDTKQIFAGENAESFVLAEGENPFQSGAEGKLVFVEDEKSANTWMMRRAESQAKYGFKTIYFDFDKADIRADERSNVDLDLKKVKALTDEGKTVIIEGHACKFAGSAEYNMMLSEKRAKTVKDYFVKRGLPADQLKVVGRGFEECLVTEGTMEQQAPNRRVEFYVQEGN